MAGIKNKTGFPLINTRLLPREEMLEVKRTSKKISNWNSKRKIKI